MACFRTTASSSNSAQQASTLPGEPLQNTGKPCAFRPRCNGAGRNESPSTTDDAVPGIGQEHGSGRSAALAREREARRSGVKIEKEAFGFRTECVIHLDSGIVLEADGFASDAYASADQATVRLEKRLRRYKRRLKDRPMKRGNSRGEPLEQ